MTQATMTQVRVQTPQGNQIGLNQVKSIQLPDGWHAVTDCQVTYLDRNRAPKAVAFGDISGFSEKEPNQNT